jgi:RHS repeat-associated protein
MPFGTRWTNGQAPTSRYQFAGYESQEFLGDKYMDAGARFYNGLTFNTPDPLSGDYPWITHYAYCGNNPVSRIDPNGMDWYSTVDKDGKVSYTYTTEYRSQKDLNKAGIEGTYIGLTGTTNDGSQYLSLLGDRFETKTADGESNMISEMVSNIDKAIISSYHAEFLNDPANRSPFDSEMYSGATNMGIPIKVTSKMVSRGDNVFRFSYMGGTVRYEANNDMSGQSFNWQTGKVERVGGYHSSIGTGANAIVQRGERNRSVNWLFPTTQAWQKARNRADLLLNNRKW